MQPKNTKGFQGRVFTINIHVNYPSKQCNLDQTAPKAIRSEPALFATQMVTD